MSPLVSSSSDKSLTERQAASSSSSGSINGREVTANLVSNPLTSVIVPKVSGAYPEINVDELPRSLARTVDGLNAIEINLNDMLHVSAEAEILELDRMFRDIDFKDIILRFAFIATLVHTVNRADMIKETYNDEHIATAREQTALLLPTLVKNLIARWEEKETELMKATNSMATGTRKSALIKMNEVKEIFAYLAKLFNDRETQFEVLGTPTFHLRSSSFSTGRTAAHWLQNMLRVHTAMKRSFSHFSSFWNETRLQNDKQGFSSRIDFMNKLISRRLERKVFSTESLAQLHDSLFPHWEVIGSMHITAQHFLLSPSSTTLTQRLGFYPYLFLQLSQELNKEHFPILMALTGSIAQSYFKMHRQYYYIAQAMNCAAQTLAIRTKRSTLDMRSIDKMIQAAREISDYFLSIDDRITEQAVYSLGTKFLSFSDMCVHLNCCVKLIEELKDSPKDCTESILYSVLDLNISTNSSIKQGLEASLNYLQLRLKALETARLAKQEIDPSQVKEILKSIETIIQLATFINDKSSAIHQLTKRILAGKPNEEKETRAPLKKQKRKGGKKGRNQKQRRAKVQPKVSIDIEKTEAKTDEDSASDTSSMIEHSPSMKYDFVEHEDEPPVSLEQVTHELISTIEVFKESVLISASDLSESDLSVSHRNVKWRTLCDELRKAGFKLFRTTGGHHHYQHPEAKEVGLATVPVNSRNSLSVGVVKNVREQIQRAENVLHE